MFKKNINVVFLNVDILLEPFLVNKIFASLPSFLNLNSREPQRMQTPKSDSLSVEGNYCRWILSFSFWRRRKLLPTVRSLGVTITLTPKYRGSDDL